MYDAQAPCQKVVLLCDPYNEPEDGPFMEFRLTYDGPLPASQYPHGSRPAAHLDTKHTMRLIFHQQLKRLWEITPFLKSGERSGPGALLINGPDAPIYDAVSLAAKHSHYDFNFVPLVTQDLNLICGLDILFLRPIGQVILFRGVTLITG